jgi:hypothetical protein
MPPRATYSRKFSGEFRDAYTPRSVVIRPANIAQFICGDDSVLRAVGVHGKGPAERRYRAARPRSPRPRGSYATMLVKRITAARAAIETG